MVNSRPPDFGEEIASCDFTFESPDGSKRSVHLRIGRPYMITPDEWACPLEIQGFEVREADVRGGDALQALGLTMSYALKRMEHFVATGGKIEHPDGGPSYTLEYLRVAFGR